MWKKIPNTFTIVFYLILIAALLTWIIPGGEYVRECKLINGTEREVVLDQSFHYVDPQPQTWTVLFALFEGFVDKADIIVFILMVGGAFWILNSTKAIDIGVHQFLCFTNSIRKKKIFKKINIDDLVFILIMTMFSLFGAVFGMSEETIAFIIIFVPMAISMGYDSIVGVCICYLAAHIGFAGAMLNPFTIGIAQGIAELPLFSGLEYRALCWVLLTFIAIVFVLFYAHKIKKNPEKSPMYHLDQYWRERAEPVSERTEAVSLKKGEKKNKKAENKSLFWVYGALTLLQIYLAIRYPFSVLNMGGSSLSLPLFPIFAFLFTIGGFRACRKSVASFNMQLLFFTILYLIVGVLAYHW
ncbi:MAG: hypothetical protein RSA02_03180 [Bacteroidales bacterium]